MKTINYLRRLCVSYPKPCGYVAAMRKLACAPEPVIKPPRQTQPAKLPTIEKHDREAVAGIQSYDRKARQGD